MVTYATGGEEVLIDDWFSFKGTLSVNQDGYALINSKVLLHREVMERHLGRKLSSRELVDHRHGKRLDNRVSELRLTTLAGNALNRTVFKNKARGLAWSDRNQTWNFKAVVNHVSVACVCSSEDEGVLISDEFWGCVQHGTNPTSTKVGEMLERLHSKKPAEFRGVTKVKNGFYARIRQGDSYRYKPKRSTEEEAARDYDDLLREFKPEMFLSMGNHLDEEPDFSRAIIRGDHLALPLPNGLFALIDMADHELVKPYTFGIESNGYVHGRLARPERYPDLPPRIRLHRYLLNPPDDMVVDHANGKLDNRRKHIKVVTYSTNSATSNRAPSKFGMRHIRPASRNTGYTVRFTRGGIEKTKNFKDLDKAIEYRDAFLANEQPPCSFA